MPQNLPHIEGLNHEVYNVYGDLAVALKGKQHIFSPVYMGLAQGKRRCAGTSPEQLQFLSDRKEGHGMRKGAALFISMLLFAGTLTGGWTLYPAVEVEAAGQNVESNLKTMEPVIKTYTNTTFFDTGQGQKKVSCSKGSDDNFWNMLQVYSIFNMNNHGGSFTYTQDELKAAAYGLFSDFNGKLPDYPESFYSSGFGTTVSGNSVTFMPVTPELQELELIDYKENDDGSVEAVYYMCFDGEEGYNVSAEMKENSNSGSGAPAYTLKSLEYNK